MASKTKIEFLRCVPRDVRDHVFDLIDGDAKGAGGLAESLAEVDAELAEIAQGVQGMDPKSESAVHLRRRQGELWSSRAAVSDALACLQRLVGDPRMKKAYALLDDANLPASDRARYVHAAWITQHDYGQVRDEIKRAQELTDQVSTKAEELAGVIRELVKFGGVPPELFSIPDLLLRTDSTDQGEPTYSEWRVFRKYILCDPSSPVTQDAPQTSDTGLRSVTQEESITADGQKGFRLTFSYTDASRDEPNNPILRYAWQKAPYLSALLDTVATRAREYVPKDAGYFGAALATRQHSPRAEYLRAFLRLLTEYGIANTRPLLKAVATTATVVLNLDGVEVLLVDVEDAARRVAEDA